MQADHGKIPLAQRILDIYPDTPKSERRLADLLLANPSSLAAHSAIALSSQAGVSKATTARFFRRLGYPSFKTAQRLERDRATGGRRERKGPEHALAELADGSIDLGLHLTTDVQNLVRTIEGLKAAELSEAGRGLARADKLWVVGFGENYPLAHFARALLIRIKPDIRMIPIGGFSVPEEFASVKPADAMLVLGLGRKTRNLESIMRSAMNAGAYVALVSDRPVQDASGIATVILRCETRGAAVFDSAVAPISVLTFLCATIAARTGTGALERLRLIDTIHDEWGDPLSGET